MYTTFYTYKKENQHGHLLDASGFFTGCGYGACLSADLPAVKTKNSGRNAFAGRIASRRIGTQPSAFSLPDNGAARVPTAGRRGACGAKKGEGQFCGDSAAADDAAESISFFAGTPEGWASSGNSGTLDPKIVPVSGSC